METTGWTPQPVWMFPRRENHFSPAGNRTPYRPVCNLVAIPTTQREFSIPSRRRSPFVFFEQDALPSVNLCVFFYSLIFIVNLIKLLADVAGFLSYIYIMPKSVNFVASLNCLITRAFCAGTSLMDNVRRLFRSPEFAVCNAAIYRCKCTLH